MRRGPVGLEVHATLPDEAAGGAEADRRLLAVPDLGKLSTRARPSCGTEAASHPPRVRLPGSAHPLLRCP